MLEVVLAAPDATNVALPAWDAAAIVAIVSRAVHILSAVILGGGLFYLRTVLAPSGPQACFADRRAVWARWVGVATAASLATGLYNFMTIVRAAKAAGHPLPGAYHMLFGAKFLLALFVMFVAAVLAGRTAAADRFRKKLGLWLGLAWSAIMAIVVLGAVMRTFH